ncbi:MAG: xylulokinase [Verrucomicrobia bacterium]|nr:MAG: xylulokinase [Verrucomicrobiota bacterium]
MKKQPVVLGVDIGTSSTKTLLVAANGRIVAEATAAYPLHSPKPGWNEQSPSDWWQATIKTSRAVMSQSGLRPSEVAGIGLSGQMHGSVFLDERGKVLRNALLWNDQRTAQQCADITAAAGGAKGLIALVNNVALTGFTAPKILWLRDNEPKRFPQLRQVLLPKDYIRYLLTGDYASEFSDAAGTLLLDVKNRCWSAPLLRKLDLDAKLFPKLYESPEVTGTLNAEAAQALGLVTGIPVVGGAGDQPAGAVGMGVVEEGIVSATLGTSGVIFAHAEKMVPNPAGVLQSFCHAVPGKWCVFGCMLSAGGSFEWAKALLYADARPKSRNVFDLMNAELARVPPGCEGLFFLPYLDGERCPHADPMARAGWIGLSRRHGRAAMARAVMEGVTFGMADQVMLMRELGVKVSEVRCGGGGAKSRFWRQLQTDIYNATTCTVDSPNAAAYGAALLGGVGVGLWPSVPAACRQTLTVRERLRPSAKSARFYTKRHVIYRQLYPTLRAIFPQL